jgi:hypothetical protein
MSMDPSKMATVFDLFRGTSGTNTENVGFGTQTGTGAYGLVALPPGKKAVQISLVTSATVTLAVQNSLDKTNWFSVILSTNSSAVWEVDSVVPFWRLNVTAHATSGTGTTAPMVASIAQQIP